MPPLTTPLTDAELERLEDIPYELNSGMAMSLEEMDGFFCALICAPEMVPPSEYLPHLWGSDDPQQSGFKTIEDAIEALTLITRHWNTIAATLLRDEPYPVLLGEYDDGDVTGREWALGFMQGMSLRQKEWERLAMDTKWNEALVPVMVLAEDEEHSISEAPAVPEEREAMLDVLDESVLRIYRYFRTPSKKPPSRRRNIRA
jgi:yecA family protein